MSVGVEPIIKDRLEAIAAVVAITTRIRVDHARPGDSFPLVIISKVDDEPWMEVGGQFNGKVRTTIEVRCISQSKTEARDLEYATRHGRLDNLGASDGLLDWSGSIGGKTVDDMTWTRTRSDFIEPDDGDPFYAEVGVYSVLSDEPVRF